MGSHDIFFHGIVCGALITALSGCTKEPAPLPPPVHSGAPGRPPQLEPATTAGSAGPLVYRGVLAGATAADTAPKCPENGAPYADIVDGIVLRSALTPFVRFEVDGYVRSCLDHTKIEVKTGDAWRDVTPNLPLKGGYSLDGTPVGYGMCDVVSCMKIGHPLCVPLVELQEVDPAKHVYESRPLRGEVRVTFPYYSDSDCKSAKLAEPSVRL